MKLRHADNRNTDNIVIVWLTSARLYERFEILPQDTNTEV